MRHILQFPNFTSEERDTLRTKLLAGVFHAPPPPDRAHLVKGPCWLYAGKWEDGKGYKKIKFKTFVLYVHRAIWELLKGPIPLGAIIDHLCKRHGCCNPDHLEPVTTKENTVRGDNPNWLMREAASKGLDAVQALGDAADPGVVPIPGTGNWEDLPRHIDGMIGDQVVEIKTTRPEFWTTPELIQAHIDHGHPRFRSPSWATDKFVPPERVVLGDRSFRVIDVPNDHLITRHYEFGVTVREPVRRCVSSADIASPEPTPAWPRRLRLFLKALWRGDFVPGGPRPPGAPTRPIGEL